MDKSTSGGSKVDDGEPTDSSRLREGSVRSAEGRRMLTACPARVGVLGVRTGGYVCCVVVNADKQQTRQLYCWVEEMQVRSTVLPTSRSVL